MNVSAVLRVIWHYGQARDVGINAALRGTFWVRRRISSCAHPNTKLMKTPARAIDTHVFPVKSIYQKSLEAVTMYLDRPI